MEGQAKLQRVLRELPAKPTQRNAKQHEGDLIAASRRLDCGAFNEVAGVQDQQLTAFEDAWSMVDKQLKELRERMLTPVFEQVRDFARAHAPSSTSTHSSWSSGLVPTVLLSIGMSADHANTYPDLMVYLRSQGHNVALISARDVQPHGAGLGAVLQSTLRQFMGAATHADDMPALLAWWAEEVERSTAGTAGTARAAGPAGPAGGATPSRQGAGAAPGACTAERAVAGQGTGAGAQPMEIDQGAAGPSSSARPSRAAQPARELRPRQQQPGDAAYAPATRRVLQPPVLIVQEAEGSDMGLMQDLVTLLHQERGRLPVTLVLGFSTAAVLFERVLPSGVGRRIAQTHIALPSPRDHLHALWRGVLLRGAPPALLLGPQCAAWLLRQFGEVDASTALLESSMRLALMEHFQQQPLSVLAPAITPGDRTQLHNAVQQLPKAALQQCHAVVAGTKPSGAHAAARGSSAPSEAARREAVEAAVWHAMQAYAKWRLAVLLMHTAAQCTGAIDGNASLQLPAIYASASSAALHEAPRGQPSQAQLLVQQLCSQSGKASVRQQDGEQLAVLLQRLLVVARAAVAAPQPPKQKQQAPIVLVDYSSSSDSDSESDSDSDTGMASAERPHTAAGLVKGFPVVAPLLKDCPEVLQLLRTLEALADEAERDGSIEADAKEDTEAMDAGGSLGATPLAAKLRGSAVIRTPTSTAGSPDAGAGSSGLGGTPLAALLAQAATVASPPHSRAKQNRRQQQRAQPQEQLQRPAHAGRAHESAPAKAHSTGIASPQTSAATGTAKQATVTVRAKATPNARTARLMSITARAAQPDPNAASASAAAGASHRAAQPQAPQRPAEPSPAARLAAALERSLPQLMVAWARAPPGAAAFLFDDAALLQSALAPAPRVALQSALARPHAHLPGCAAAMGLEWEDACIAYGLLERHEGDMMPTADWFGQFASVHGLRPGRQDDAAAADEEAGGSGKKARAGARCGRGGKTRVRPDDAAQVAAAQAGRRQRVAAARAAATAQAQAAAAGPSAAPAPPAAGRVDAKKLLEAAARFCRAVNELQFVGVARPLKRRKVATVQRTFMPMVVHDVAGPGAAV